MVLAHDIGEGFRTQDVQITENITFDMMLLTPNTLEGLTTSGFYKPSPIQLHGIPLGKCGFDLLLEAKSGTGKTAVFTVIALEKLDLEKGLQTIILAPTREIAAQISDVIKQIGSSYQNLNVEMVIGGLPTHEDIEKFKKKVHIVVGSPGRLRHLIQADHIDVSAVRLFVLDEADKLMDKSFQADINYIFAVLPKEKQVIMSSATYPEILKSVMKRYVQNAQHICPDSNTILLGIKQLVTTVKSNSNIVRQTQNRFEELLKILSKKQFKQCLIFCNYQVRVRDLCKMLMREKWPAEQLHGQQEQTDRLDALKMLQEYKCRILISTDLAARGIDASNVDLVINFEPPYEWQTYLHRIGRAGRFGSYGIAITILSKGQEEKKFKKMINAINGSLNLKNLWDEEKFDFHEYDDEESSKTAVEHKTEGNNVYNELLKNLTHGNAKNFEETESLETSCIKPKETKIETFDDLLNCFESHKINNNDSPGQFDKESSNSFSPKSNLQNDLLLKFNTNKDLEENLTKIRNKISSNKENHTKESEKEDCNKTNISATNNLAQSMLTNNAFCDLEPDESHMFKALLDAGLPTSFSSSKSCKKKLKKIHSTHQTNENEKIYYTQECTDIKHKETGNTDRHSSSGTELHSELEKEKRLHNRCKSDCCNKQINSNYLRVDIHKKPKRSCKHYNNSFRDIKDSHIYSHEQVDMNNDRYKKYTIWYNHLKNHVEQIKMALYIDEISKI